MGLEPITSLSTPFLWARAHKVLLQICQRGSWWNCSLSLVTILTSSVAWPHHSSNSANPDFTYSPLLNVQHSRRRRRLQQHQTRMHLQVILIAYNLYHAKRESRTAIYLLKSCTLIYEKIWLNIFWTNTGGTWNKAGHKFMVHQNPKKKKVLIHLKHGLK